MLSATLAAFAAVALPLVQAQAVSLSSLPQCAQVPVVSGLGSTGCDPTDFSCICQAVSFIQGVTASIQAACGQEDQQKTLALTKALCNRYGVTISVPDVAVAPVEAPAEAPAAGDQAQPVPEAAQAAQAATSPSPATGVESKAADMAAAAVSTAPVSPDDVSSSYTSDMDMGAMETPPPSSSPAPLISYDTKSTIPSATIASATDVRPQMSAPTMHTAYNGTTNSTVAASSPIPYVGAAAAMAGNVQAAVMAMLAVVGVFWGL